MVIAGENKLLISEGALLGDDEVQDAIVGAGELKWKVSLEMRGSRS